MRNKQNSLLLLLPNSKEVLSCSLVKASSAPNGSPSTERVDRELALGRADALAHPPGKFVWVAILKTGEAYPLK
jgi:hypothetical protein